MLILTAGIGALIFTRDTSPRIRFAQPPPSFSVTGVEAVTAHLDLPDDVRTISFGLPTSRIATSSDLSPFADLVMGQVTAWRTRYEARQLTSASPGALNISWHTPVASGGVLAERLTYVGSASGDELEHDFALFYTDLATGAAWPARELLAADAFGRIARATMALPNATSFADTAFFMADPVLLPSGELLLSIPQAATSADSVGEVWLRVSTSHAATLLSPLGKQLRQKVMAGPLLGAPSSLDDDAAPHPLPLPSPLLPTPSLTSSGTPSPAPTAVPLPTSVPLPTPEPDPIPDPAPPLPPAPTPTTSGTDCSKVKCIALTFDDGPGQFTEALLNHLDKGGALATFFVLGQNVELHPKTVQKISAAGHVIGNHSYSHPNFTQLTAEQLQREVTSTNRAISAATGYKPTFVRPPYGAVDAPSRAVTSSLGSQVVLWSVDSEDWRSKNAKAIAQQVISQAKPGAIVLMHDIHEETVQAVPTILRELKSQGYHFVTIDQI